MKIVVVLFGIFSFLISGFAASFAPWLIEQGVIGMVGNQHHATWITAVIGGALGIGIACMVLYMLMPIILKKKTASS